MLCYEYPVDTFTPCYKHAEYDLFVYNSSSVSSSTSGGGRGDRASARIEEPVRVGGDGGGGGDGAVVGGAVQGREVSNPSAGAFTISVP